MAKMPMRVPNTAEVVQTFRGVVKVINLYEELLRDASFFKDLAERLPDDQNYDFERWRYLRASTIHSFIAIESYINYFIKESLQRDDLSKATKDFFYELKRLSNNYLRIDRIHLDLKLTCYPSSLC